MKILAGRFSFIYSVSKTIEIIILQMLSIGDGGGRL